MAMAIVAFTVAAVASALGAAYRNQTCADARARALGLGRNAVESIAVRSVQSIATDAAGTAGGASDSAQPANGSSPSPGLLGSLLGVVKQTVDTLAGQTESDRAAQPAVAGAAPAVDLPTAAVFALNGSAPGPAVTAASAEAGKFLVRVAVPAADGSTVTLDRVVADLSPRD